MSLTGQAALVFDADLKKKARPTDILTPISLDI